jgi:uncharacterized protein YraI/beta-lactamase class A
MEPFFWQPLKRLLLLSIGSTIILVLGLAWPDSAHGQTSGTPQPVWVEAIKTANVRSGPSLEYPQIGVITAGTKYQLVGRSARARWYLIKLPHMLGWVYVDLVIVTGDLKNVPYDETVITYLPPTDTPNPEPAAAEPTNTAELPTPVATLTLPPLTGIVAEAANSSIVRYGPGSDFPRVGRIVKGQAYPVLRRHALFPWLEIAYPAGPAGRGWVYRDAVTITGDLNSVPVTSDRSFGYPTLTATPLMVVTNIPAWTLTPVAGPNEVLQKLGDDIYAYLLAQHFEPGTERQGAVFIMNLRTGHMFSVNPNVAFSATSLMKIPVLVSLYRKFGERPPTDVQARAIASMMVCSQNESANASLRFLGDGDINRGIAYVMETLRSVGLTHTILGRPFADVPPPPAPPGTAVQSDFDQQSTQPDPLNQSTPADLGWLLAGIYQCAVDNSGPLVSAYPAALTAPACRQMVSVMRANKIDIMIEAGVPDGIVVAHKQGWGEDTHGDAGLVITPGGDYILVVMLHAETHLGFDSSAPTIAEISRLTYNVFNASRALDAIHPQPIPECSISPDLVGSLQLGDAPPIH